MKALTYVLALAVGFALSFLFFKPKVIESIVIKTEERLDTIYTSHVDTVFITDTIIEQYVDTVYYSEPHESFVTSYSGERILEYGKLDWKAETTGKLLNLSIVPSFEIPTIIKEIETTKTITQVRDLRGLYAGASVSSDIDYKVGASYVDRDWQFNYDYQPRAKIHWVGIRKRLF